METCEVIVLSVQVPGFSLCVRLCTWSAPVRWMKLSSTEALSLSITSIANSSSP